MSHEPENDSFPDYQPSQEELDAELEAAIAADRQERAQQERTYQDGIELAEEEGIRSVTFRIIWRNLSTIFGGVEALKTPDPKGVHERTPAHKFAES